MKSGIYKIENRTTKRCYIGSAIDIKDRLRTHRKLLAGNRHPNKYFQAAWNKYGAGQFEFAPILICRKDDLLFYEQRAIDGLAAVVGLYNLAPIAGSMLGFRHTSETKEKFKSCPQLRAGKTLSTETRAAISAGLKGHEVSDHHRRVTSARFRGKKLTPEHREKLAAAKRGRPQPPELVAKRAAGHMGKKRTPWARERMAQAQRQRRMREALKKVDEPGAVL